MEGRPMPGSDEWYLAGCKGIAERKTLKTLIEIRDILSDIREALHDREFK